MRPYIGFLLGVSLCVYVDSGRRRGAIGAHLRDHLKHLLLQAEHLLDLDTLNTEVTEHDIEECLYHS